MINLIVADIKDFKDMLARCKADIDGFEESFVKTLADAQIKVDGKNKDLLYTRIAAYRVLELIYPMLYKNKYCGIMRDKEGKPHLKLEKTGNFTLPPEFSLSHSGDLVALGFYQNDENITDRAFKIGVDIEEHREIQHEKNLELKYLKNVNNNLQNNIKIQEKLSFFTLSANGKSVKNIGELEDVQAERIMHNEWNFFDKWTRFEATLKADGRGFGSLKCFDENYSLAHVSTYRIKYKDKEYSLSPALL